MSLSTTAWTLCQFIGCLSLPAWNTGSVLIGTGFIVSTLWDKSMLAVFSVLPIPPTIRSLNAAFNDAVSFLNLSASSTQLWTLTLTLLVVRRIGTFGSLQKCTEVTRQYCRQLLERLSGQGYAFPPRTDRLFSAPTISLATNISSAYCGQSSASAAPSA